MHEHSLAINHLINTSSDGVSTTMTLYADDHVLILENMKPVYDVPPHSIMSYPDWLCQQIDLYDPIDCLDNEQARKQLSHIKRELLLSETCEKLQNRHIALYDGRPPAQIDRMYFITKLTPDEFQCLLLSRENS